MKIGNLDLQQKISNQVAFSVILIFGLVVAMITINIGEKIIAGFPESASIKVTNDYDLVKEKAPVQNKSIKK